MAIEATNTTGWIDLINGNLIGASYGMYDSNFGVGWIIVILLIVYQIMVIVKTRNIILAWATSAIFIAVAYGGGLLSATTNAMISGSTVIFAIMVFELAFILYALVIKRL
jgi:hypothetical protein